MACANTCEDLVFRLHKAKCVELLAKAVQIWKVILDHSPKETSTLRQADVHMLEEVWIDTSRVEHAARPLTISHEVVACPTAKDFDEACQDFCRYARTNLAPYMLKSLSRQSGENIHGDVMRIMGCLSFVQVLAVN